jgi:TolA-binding protein
MAIKPLQTNNQIDQLQAQIASLQGSKQEPEVDMRQIIKEEISSQLAEIKSLIANSQQPVAKKPLTILEAIGLALHHDEQVWLSQESSIKGIPDFLATDQGKEITRLFFDSYKETKK